MGFFKKLIKKVENNDRSILKDLKKVVEKNLYTKDIYYEIIFILIYHKKIKRDDLYKIFEGHEVLEESLDKILYIDCFEFLQEDFIVPTTYQQIKEWKNIVKYYKDKNVKIEIKEKAINVVFKSKNVKKVKVLGIFFSSGGFTETFIGASKKHIRDKNLNPGLVRDISNLCLITEINGKITISISNILLNSTISLMIKDNDKKVMQIQATWEKFYEDKKRIIDKKVMKDEKKYKPLADYRKKMANQGKKLI